MDLDKESGPDNGDDDFRPPSHESSETEDEEKKALKEQLAAVKAKKAASGGKKQKKGVAARTKIEAVKAQIKRKASLDQDEDSRQPEYVSFWILPCSFMIPDSHFMPARALLNLNQKSPAHPMPLMTTGKRSSNRPRPNHRARRKFPNVANRRLPRLILLDLQLLMVVMRRKGLHLELVGCHLMVRIP